MKSDCNVQLNIEDLTECFKHLELKLGERSNRKFPSQRPRSSLYCIMRGKSGHLVRECDDSRFLIAQEICMMDLNNRVVMTDGSPLPRAEGEDGAAKLIENRLAGNKPSGP